MTVGEQRHLRSEGTIDPPSVGEDVRTLLAATVVDVCATSGLPFCAVSRVKDDGAILVAAQGGGRPRRRLRLARLRRAAGAAGDRHGPPGPARHARRSQTHRRAEIVPHGPRRPGESRVRPADGPVGSDRPDGPRRSPAAGHRTGGSESRLGHTPRRTGARAGRAHGGPRPLGRRPRARARRRHRGSEPLRRTRPGPARRRPAPGRALRSPHGRHLLRRRRRPASARRLELRTLHAGRRRAGRSRWPSAR